MRHKLRTDDHAWITSFTLQAYLAKANQTEGPQDCWIDSWLQEFVQRNGYEKVQEVLGDYRRADSSKKKMSEQASTTAKDRRYKEDQLLTSNGLYS